MKFLGSAGPDSEVALQAAMPSAGCECNHTVLEIARRCRISIPGSAGRCGCFVSG